MSNVTNTSLKKAGVPPVLWARAKAICNSPSYRPSRQLCRLLDGPWADECIYLDDWDSPRLTAPIKIGDQVGYYRAEARIYPKGSIGKWVAL